MRILKVLFILIPIFSFSFFVNAQEIRLGAKVDYKLNKKIKTELLIQQRFSEHNMRSESSRLMQAKIRYKQNKHFSYALGIRYKREQDLSNNELNDASDKLRLTADIKTKIPDNIKHVTFYNRLRFQQTRNMDDRYWYLVRNQISVQYKYSKLLDTGISYEVFYNATKNNLAMGRLKFKINHQLSKKFGLAGYFMVDSAFGNKKFDHYYIIGSQLVYRI